jgi:hypothetical protein
MHRFWQGKNSSHLLLVAPFGLAVWFGLYLYAAIIALASITSTLYHLADEKKFVLSDHAFAYLIISTNFFFAWLGGFASPYFPMAIFLGALALHFHSTGRHDRQQYNLFHALWHTVCACITILCILTFVAGTR